jgi:Cu2+-exporting ATPase
MSKSIKKNYPVKGMGCAACVARVQGALRAQKGVINANVNLANNMAQIDYDPQLVTPEGLKKAVQDAGYDLMTDEGSDSDDEADRSRQEYYQDLRRDTILSIVLAALIMLLGMGFHDFPFKGYLLWLLATPAVIWCGRRFFTVAWKQMLHFNANMDTLVALSISISYLFSVFNLLFPQVWTSKGLSAHLYFESSSMIVAFILIGRLLEEKAKNSTTASIRELVGLQPKTVTVLRTTEQVIPISDVVKGDTVVVKPGERVAVDGTLTSGESYVDESMLTGEPMAVKKSCGAKVYAGTINQKGSFHVRTDKVGKDTMLSAIINMVRDAQGSKAPIQDIVDKVAAVFVPVIIVIAILSCSAWMIFSPTDGVTHGLLALVTVLVIACPCSLGLATPTAIIAGIGNGASKGILIKDAQSLQIAGKINAVVLDKTGTLTNGHPMVVRDYWSDESKRSWLMSMERKSEHPLAEAIVEHYNGLEPVEVADFESISGQGIKGSVDGIQCYAGNGSLMEAIGIAGDAIDLRADEWEKDGDTVIRFASENHIVGIVAISDEVKDTSFSAVKEMQGKGINVYMLTGDNKATAAIIASKVGIDSDNVIAEVLPQDKANAISSLQDNGYKVAMVGDGINDSAALAQADLSIAMGKGSDIAIDSSMATIVSSDLGKIPQLIGLSHRTVKIIYENLFWAFIYNILAVPIAAGVFYPINGFLLNPMVAAACMAMSSVCVVTNSLRLKRG